MKLEVTIDDRRVCHIIVDDEELFTVVMIKPYIAEMCNMHIPLSWLVKNDTELGRNPEGFVKSVIDQLIEHRNNYIALISKAPKLYIRMPPDGVNVRVDNGKYRGVYYHSKDKNDEYEKDDHFIIVGYYSINITKDGKAYVNGEGKSFLIEYELLDCDYDEDVFVNSAISYIDSVKALIHFPKPITNVKSAHNC